MTSCKRYDLYKSYHDRVYKCSAEGCDRDATAVIERGSASYKTHDYACDDHVRWAIFNLESFDEAVDEDEFISWHLTGMTEDERKRWDGSHETLGAGNKGVVYKDNWWKEFWEQQDTPPKEYLFNAAKEVLANNFPGDDYDQP